jgi:hypothetical protein
MIGPLEHRQRVRRVGFLGAEELLYSLEAVARYLSEPHEIGNGTTGHKAKTIAQAARTRWIQAFADASRLLL